jgi:predicted phage-related endonuclease
MPDPSKQSVSSTQIPMLWNQSPYGNRWLLWQHFKNGVPIEARENERMRSGKLFQQAILQRVAEVYSLEMRENVGNAYRRRGRVGATIDGELLVPGGEPIIVEAKNVDWLVWKNDWSETAAPPHVELQVQTHLHVTGHAKGIIGVCIGGNDFAFYERERDPAVADEIVAEAESFFASLERGEEPASLGDKKELAALAHLYPTADKAIEVVDMDDEALAQAVQSYKHAAEQASFWDKTKEGLKAKILARAGNAAALRCRFSRVEIGKTPVAPLVCQPHVEPKETRASYIRTTLKVRDMNDEPFPAPKEGLQA